jgi:hypothetical protein
VLGIYPLKPVITSNRAFAALYDLHPHSLFHISGCLTPSEAESLIDQGAVFDTVVLLNGEGEELIARLTTDVDPQDQRFSRVERIDAPVIDVHAVGRVHLVLRDVGVRDMFQPKSATPS